LTTPSIPYIYTLGVFSTPSAASTDGCGVWLLIIKKKEAKMSKKKRDLEKTELTPEELEDQEVSELPDREAMSLVNANIAAPINAAWRRTFSRITR